MSQSMVAGVENMRVGGYKACFEVQALETREVFVLASCKGTNRGICQRRKERKKDDGGY